MRSAAVGRDGGVHPSERRPLPGTTQSALKQAEAFARAVHTPVGYLFFTEAPAEPSYEVVRHHRIHSHYRRRCHDVVLRINGVPVIRIERRQLVAAPAGRRNRPSGEMARSPCAACLWSCCRRILRRWARRTQAGRGATDDQRPRAPAPNPGAVRRHQGCSNTLPTDCRALILACAAPASARGNTRSMMMRRLPARIMPNTAAARVSSSGRVAT